MTWRGEVHFLVRRLLAETIEVIRKSRALREVLVSAADAISSYAARKLWLHRALRVLQDLDGQMIDQLKVPRPQLGVGINANAAS